MTSPRRIVGILAAVVSWTVVLLALVGPFLVTRDPAYIVGPPYAERGPNLLLGADFAGRDVVARVLAGGRPLVEIPVLAVALTALLGTALGLLAGYLGGVVDTVISYVDNAFLTVPPILVLLVLLHGLGYTTVTLIAVVVATGAPFVSRIVRAATAQVVRSGYVEQAVALGETTTGVLVREILPNVVGPVLADAGTRLAIAVGLTASAGFLGFGPDEANWGAMISQNVEGISLNPWGVVVPAVGLAVLAITANLTLDKIAARVVR